VLRITLLALCCYSVYILAADPLSGSFTVAGFQIKSMAWMRFLSMMLGFMIYVFLFKIFSLYMFYAWECETLGGSDQMFIYEKEDNRHIILAACCMETFDYDTMRQ